MDKLSLVLVFIFLSMSWAAAKILVGCHNRSSTCEICRLKNTEIFVKVYRRVERREYFRGDERIDVNLTDLILQPQDPMDESLMDMFETINVTQGFFSEIPWVRSVALKYMNLQGESPFRRSVFLETVRLIGNRLEEIPQDLLWGINNLRTLKIQYQNIKSLSPASFTKITSYLDKEISLESVNLTTIEPGTFAKFDYLKTLSLAFNKLQVLTADMFKGLERLQILRLNSNQINMIQPATFDGVINIHELLLESNKLTSLPDGCFVKLDSLEVLNLDVDWTPFDIIGRARSLFTETYWLKHIKPVLDEFRQLQ